MLYVYANSDGVERIMFIFARCINHPLVLHTHTQIHTLTQDTAAGGTGGQSPEALIDSVATDVLKRLPKAFDRDETLRKYPTSYHQV